MSENSTIRALFDSIGLHEPGPDTARVVVHGNRVIGSRLVPGLEVDARETADGIEADISVRGGARLENPVHMCFGMLPETGEQRIVLRVRVGRGAAASILAHCTFPNAVNITHAMDAEIEIGDGAEYSYFERHVHGREGGVLVVPKARVRVGENARFKTEFELIRGRVGRIDIDYETRVGARGVLEMIARISGKGTDRIRINETGILEGEGARGVLTSYIAVRGRAKAEINNRLVANAPYARGHVDCKEIVQDQATASAVPIVEVNHPKARVTHEASIGSVDSKQLETLRARGLTEDDAVERIIQGLLS
ncbi:MAG: SufD family Fe-S cluster assembly protein [Candidatus Eisenbacteria bacterium]